VRYIEGHDSLKIKKAGDIGLDHRRRSFLRFEASKSPDRIGFSFVIAPTHRTSEIASMMRPSISVAVSTFAALTILSALGSQLDAAEPVPESVASEPLGVFQVTIEIDEVLGDGTKQPQDRHLILFKAGKAYDFALSSPHDVTVIDPIAARVTLLSRQNHVKSTILHQDIIAAAAGLKSYAEKQGLEDRLGVNAKAIQDAEDPKRYRVAFAGYRYDATSSTPTAETQPARFAEFTDWVARVNLVHNLGTPPFARMTLGRTLAADGVIPSTVTLSLASENRKRTFESRYTFKDGLSPENEKRIKEVPGMMTLYQEVPLDAFPR
jgi:hypothetical protein